MNTKTISTPNFMGRVAKIIAEIRNRAYIDGVDEEVIETILKEDITEYYRMLDGYYKEEYYNAISSARNEAYYEGHSDGYARGYDVGYEAGHPKSHSAV